MAARKIINVKKVTKKEVAEFWNINLPTKWPDILYIRCNAKGDVNWDKAPVYPPEKLIERGNYNVIN
jgi:hypothetical protein